MPNIEPFEKFTDSYDKWYDKKKAIYQSELNAFKEYSGLSGKGIEIGVGTGRFAAPFGIEYGIDPSNSMLKYAKHRGVKVVQGVAEYLPFRDAIFNYALMVTAICFFDDLRMALKEAYRVLGASGILLIGFIEKNSRLGRSYEKHREDNVFYKNAHFYSAQDLTSYMKEAGFSNFAFTQTLFQPFDQIYDVEPVKEGYGEGSFVVLTGCK